MEWTSLLKPEKERAKSSVTKTSNDKRSPFKADLDTVCNCTGIRRLQDKAQVFPLEKSDYARTRLTHSLEVMSIAESLGVHAVKVILEKENPEEETKELLMEIPVILRAAALLHDMGNPPFGHLGEGIIAGWFKEKLSTLIYDSNDKKVLFSDKSGKGVDSLVNKLSAQQQADLELFEGNAQLLRLITRLSYVVDEHGMNLTYPVLATIIKYPCSAFQCKENKEKNATTLLTKKPGYFCSENDLYQRINKALRLGGKRHPLTFLLEAADDIAYLTADIEDAHKKGIISFSMVENCFKSSEYRDNKFVQRILDEINKYREQGFEKGVGDIDNYVMQRLRIFIKGNMISQAMDSFSENYWEIMNGSFENELLMMVEAKDVVKIIKEQIEQKHIYYCKEIVESKIRAYRILSTLLDSFVLSVFNVENNGSKDERDSLIYNLLSDNYRFMCDKANEGKTKLSGDYIYNKLLLVTDVVCGMTDSYALDIYDILMAHN